ncbi:MAG: hypothetical protein IPJ65_35240 [Archangiaceae bacterium]|nr:hypothetical protein [Archangiaceae bacterium]
MAASISSSPSKALFTAEQWKRIEANPTAPFPDAEWAAFTPDQKTAVKKLQREYFADGTARQLRPRDQAALQGGDGGAFYAGRSLAIHEVQGPGAKSPYDGQAVTTAGIVTAVEADGFYLQEPNVGTENGSPAIYVRARGHQVKAGDEVSVAGVVEEYVPPKQRESNPDSSVTNLNAHPGSILVKSSGNPLPEFVIGKGGIELSHTASNFDLWESLEGARVRINDPVVVGALNDIPRFSDGAVVPDGGEGAGKRTVSGGLVRDAYGNPHVIGVRMPVDDLKVPVNIGARFRSALTGNVTERHGRHQVTVWDPGGVKNLIPSPIVPAVATLRTRFADPEHVLFIASLNGENKDVKVEDLAKVQGQDERNVDDDVGEGKLQRMAEQIVKNLTSPDIVAMQEIQDNDGNELSETVDASETWQAIIEKIVELGGPRYAWVDRPPVNNAEGGAPGGNIRTGFLYNPERVKLREESVYRLEDPAFAGARLPLVATFEFTHGGQTEVLKLQSVHNTSKRGRTPEEANERQVAQARVLNRWATQNAPQGDFEHLGIFGDRNAYTDEPAMQAEVEGGVLDLLSLQLPEEQRYSAQFGGSSGELDHATAKSKVPVAIELVHMNSDFDERFRSSDHDGTLTAWDFRRGRS